jgi:hypothetical protein
MTFSVTLWCSDVVGQRPRVCEKQELLCRMVKLHAGTLRTNTEAEARRAGGPIASQDSGSFVCAMAGAHF